MSQGPWRLNDKEIISFLRKTGHLECPFGVRQDVPVDDDKLTLKDVVVREAIRSHQSLDENYEVFAMARHGRSLIPDGDPGPATVDVMSLPRCGMPDYGHSSGYDGAEAAGSGNWRGCHDVGNYHALSVEVTNAPPSHVAPVWEDVKRRTREAYAEVGLLIHWDGREPVGTRASFVRQSDGWIGLAIVCNDCTCDSGPIWCRYLSTYRGGSTERDILTQWTSLFKHEIGHNCGMGHVRGGVMNPSIVNGLPVSWRGDPSWQQLVSRFGGRPVPTGPVDKKLMLAWEVGGSYERIMYLEDVGAGPFRI